MFTGHELNGQRRCRSSCGLLARDIDLHLFLVHVGLRGRLLKAVLGECIDRIQLFEVHLLYVGPHIADKHLLVGFSRRFFV